MFGNRWTEIAKVVSGRYIYILHNQKRAFMVNEVYENG